MEMTKLLGLAAVLEGATGLVLMIHPACLADTSRLLYPSGRVLELESETRLAIMLILTLGGHSGFRVTGTGQVHGGNEVQTLAQRQLDPVPTDLHIALAPKPMGVHPAALALLDHLGALGDEIERR